MYSVIIADDEKWVVESLKIRVNWEEYDFQVIGQAYNGLQALELCQQLKPDLVFADVRMPGMSGLELIEKASTAFPGILFVLVSGYAEFEYVQKALNYGVLGYCLKPVNPKEIERLLENAGNIIKRKTQKQLDLFRLLEDGPEGGEQLDLPGALAEIGVEWKGGSQAVVVVFIGDKYIDFHETLAAVSFKVGPHKTLHLLEDLDTSVLIGKLKPYTEGAVKGIGIGRSITTIQEVYEAFEEAEIAAYHFYITGRNDVYKIGTIKQNDLDHFFIKLAEVLQKKDMSSIENAFIESHTLFQNGEYNIRHAFRFFNTVISFIFRQKPEQGEDYVYSFDQLIGSFSNVHSMIDYLKELAVKSLQGMTDSMYKEVKNKTLKSILHYVDDNFRKEISIQYISQKYYINPKYICQLFKKKVGKTFTQYISDMRISYASELLRESDLSIGEIGVKCGFNDYFYFNKIFKKITGFTPSQFRANKK